MKFVSLDLETSTLKPGIYNILSMALVLHTDYETPVDELPSLRFLFTCPPTDTSNVALAMNAPLFLAIEAARTGKTVLDDRWRDLVPSEVFDRAWGELIMTTHAVYDQNDAVGIIKQWLSEHGVTGKIPLAGKNIGTFDWQFLCDGIRGLFSHRTLDPGSMYLHAEDVVPPDTKECCYRAGIATEVTHNAYEDAMQVVELIRHWLRH